MSRLILPSTQKFMHKLQKFTHFLVLDFEATCERNTKLNPMEIIEFPVVKINAQTLLSESEFHHYVRPVVHPDLTDFCTELTGIIQDMVEYQPCLEDVLKLFDEYLFQEGLTDGGKSFAFVTCGDWDLKTMLPSQCRHLGISVPSYFRQWINLKQVYRDVMGQFPFGMLDMLSGLGLPHRGRHHSGIDDARNIANILCELIRRGAVPTITCCLPQPSSA
ncbi:hypothetical protein EG68_01421 [Paragonimus skrjabini miyazakii]|uniref:Exonuclease domain-containing protein n=1 Tax=Paragonimus skrjabini miyazakii TaxID=59628 RepID=A0A8S9ZBU9_9TREM|nr:hypothetical protein EG68_01421 [Paragonimus skrjabini miyazakii]